MWTTVFSLALCVSGAAASAVAGGNCACDAATWPSCGGDRAYHCPSTAPKCVGYQPNVAWGTCQTVQCAANYREYSGGNTIYTCGVNAMKCFGYQYNVQYGACGFTFNNLGDNNWLWNNVYNYDLSGPYTVTLSKWTHTRNYAGGFLANGEGGDQNPIALVKGLKPNAPYSIVIYQVCDHESYCGKTNQVQVQGGARTDIVQPGKHTVTGYSDGSGQIELKFTRLAPHIHLSDLLVTAIDTNSPTNHPTGHPTKHPTGHPTKHPTGHPTGHPTDAPTVSPTDAPTDAPTVSPTDAPTVSPTDAPTDAPTVSPTSAPTTEDFQAAQLANEALEAHPWTTGVIGDVAYKCHDFDGCYENTAALRKKFVVATTEVDKAQLSPETHHTTTDGSFIFSADGIVFVSTDGLEEHHFPHDCQCSGVTPLASTVEEALEGYFPTDAPSDAPTDTPTASPSDAPTPDCFDWDFEEEFSGNDCTHFNSLCVDAGYTSAGSHYDSNGVSASEACCGCGGGARWY